jgi:hypothetical protein
MEKKELPDWIKDSIRDLTKAYKNRLMVHTGVLYQSDGFTFAQNQLRIKKIIRLFNIDVKEL